MRQRCQLNARTLDAPRARDRHSLGVRRRPRPTCSAVVDREHVAGAGGRCGGAAAGRWSASASGHLCREVHDSRGRDSDRRLSAAVYACGFARNGSCIRIDAGIHIRAESDGCAEGGGRANDVEHTSSTRQKRVDRRTGRDLIHVADRRWAYGAKLDKASASESRLQPRERTYDEAESELVEANDQRADQGLQPPGACQGPVPAWSAISRAGVHLPAESERHHIRTKQRGISNRGTTDPGPGARASG